MKATYFPRTKKGSAKVLTTPSKVSAGKKRPNAGVALEGKMAKMNTGYYARLGSAVKKSVKAVPQMKGMEN